MEAEAMNRLQLLRPPSTVTCSLWLRNNHLCSTFRPHLCGNHLRRFSTKTLLCSTSDELVESSNVAGSSSVVGDLLDYLNESWTQFHATAEAKRQLIAAGFCLLNANDDWDLKPGGQYFFTRNMSCLVAFAIGENSQVLSDELDCSIDDILSIELNVCDTQPSCLGGGNNEFIFSGRLDNLASSYCALRALVDSCEPLGGLSTEQTIWMVTLFDNEEVGSNSVQGAGAPTMFQAMRCIVDCLAHEHVGEGAFQRAIHQSFLVSADTAHGVHPNFVDKHEECHHPEMQKGLVIKHNANQRYATSGVTAFLFKEVAKMHDLPTQEFVVRNDMGCGSTIGPILASGVGIRTVDCGIS